jgi:hypothetical protein
MRPKALIVALALSLTLAGCAHTPPSTTPIFSPTASALLVTALGALQTGAIALAPVDGIPAADTTVVVNFVSVAIATIQAGATGYVSAVDVLLSKLPGALSPSTAATLAPYVDIIETALNDLYGGGVS